MIREANKNDLDEILQLYYKRATMEDIDELVRTRIIVLRAADKLSDDEDITGRYCNWCVGIVLCKECCYCG